MKNIKPLHQTPRTVATKYQTESSQIAVYSSTVLEAWCLKSRCLWFDSQPGHWRNTMALPCHDSPLVSGGDPQYSAFLGLQKHLAMSLHIFFLCDPVSSQGQLFTRTAVIWDQGPTLLQFDLFGYIYNGPISKCGRSHSEFLGITTLILSFLG